MLLNPAAEKQFRKTREARKRMMYVVAYCKSICISRKVFSTYVLWMVFSSTFFTFRVHHSFIRPFIHQILPGCCIASGTILGAGVTKVNKRQSLVSSLFSESLMF